MRAVLYYSCWQQHLAPQGALWAFPAAVVVHCCAQCQGAEGAEHSSGAAAWQGGAAAGQHAGCAGAEQQHEAAERAPAEGQPQTQGRKRKPEAEGEGDRGVQAAMPTPAG